MLFLYNLGIRFYYFLILILSPFNKKAKLWLAGRKNWYARLSQIVKKDEKTVWIHCSSLGEFEQGRPLIEKLKQSYPNLRIFLTFFSPSGYEIRKNYAGAEYISYLPLDTKHNAKKLIGLINPIAVIFVKYEFWYHYLNELNKRKVPTYIVSAIFRDDQAFFKSYGKWYKNFLYKFTHFFVQNEQSKQLLNGIGISNVTIAGDTRFDRVLENAKALKDIKILEEFSANAQVLIAGSTWPKDEELLVNFFKTNNDPAFKMILAPHEINPGAIQRLRNQLAENSLLYTKPEEDDPSRCRVLIIDTIGILAYAYRYGHIAYIGGGFGAGIHNTLEAAAYGIPVVFGPNYKKFQEAKDLIEIGAAFSIKNLDELSEVLTQLMCKNDKLVGAGNLARNYILKGVGASSLIIKMLEKDILKFPNQ